MKIKLKHLLKIKLNTDEMYGKITKFMVWSPVLHYWVVEDEPTYDNLAPSDKKFLLNQDVVKLGLRNDMPDHLAIFLKDYGTDKNYELRHKLNMRRLKRGV